MKNQVTSIEQSKRLIEQGVPAQKASMVWDTISPASHPVLRIWDTSTDTKRWQVDHVGHVPAFTVADLLGMLPPDIPAIGEQNHDYFLTLSNGFCWSLRYENSRMPHMYIGEKLEFDLIDLLCDRIEWLLSNGYKLEV